MTKWLDDNDPDHLKNFGEVNWPMKHREQDHYVPMPVGLNPLGGECQCVSEHSPTAFVPTTHHILPQSWGGQTIDSNLIDICPNTHTAVHRLIDDYVRNGGVPSWDIRQHFSEFQRALALRAWLQRPDNPTITSTQFHH